MMIIRLRSESSFLKFRIFDFNFYSASSSMPLTAFITYNTQNQYTVESDKLKIVLIEIAIFCVVRHNRTLSEAILGIKKKERESFVPYFRFNVAPEITSRTYICIFKFNLYIKIPFFIDLESHVDSIKAKRAAKVK